ILRIRHRCSTSARERIRSRGWGHGIVTSLWALLFGALAMAQTPGAAPNRDQPPRVPIAPNPVAPGREDLRATIKKLENEGQISKQKLDYAMEGWSKASADVQAAV